MSWFQTDLTFAAAPISMLFAAEASTPVYGSSDTGTDLIIPVPIGTANDDVLLAVTATSGENPSIPSGWSLLLNMATGANVYSRTASSEPTDYTWTTSAGTGRAGVMVAVRGGTIGDTAGDTGTTTIPDVTAVKSGAALIAVAAVVLVTSLETLTSDAPLTDAEEHRANGTGGANPRSAIAAYEFEVGSGLISGRTFNYSGSDVFVSPAAIIIEPA